MATTQELIGVEIPAEFVELASGWYRGMDMFYAITSTGGLSLGTNRPYNTDEDRPMTDTEWHHHLWCQLSVDAMVCRMKAEKSGHEDAAALAEFEAFADETCERLAEAYGLEW